MIFRGWLKTSFIEYPEKIATVLFTEGCNFRCPFCHNPELVLSEDSLPRINESEVLAFLDQRKGMIDAVCITGGEPLLHVPALLPFLEKVKNRGFLIKIDTNGSFFNEFRELSQAGLVDLWGIDYKLPFSQYSQVQGFKWHNNCHQVLEEALNTPQKAEIRTTIFPPFHNEHILKEMAQHCSSATHWYWQNFHNQKTLTEKAQTIQPYSPSQLKKWKNLINAGVGKDLVVIRPDEQLNV